MLSFTDHSIFAGCFLLRKNIEVEHFKPDLHITEDGKGILCGKPEDADPLDAVQ
jgi:hypothetical protein